MAPAASPVLSRAWHLAAGVGLAVFAAYAIFGSPIGFEDFFNRYLYNVLILLAFAACLRRALQGGGERSAWIALTTGVGFWLVAEVIFDFVYAGDPPYPSAADVFYLAFYPPCWIGLMLLVRSRVSTFSRTLWFDGAMAATASAALGAAVLFEVVLTSTDGSTSVIVTNLAYPLGDILLLAAAVGVFALTGWRPGRSWSLIGAALAATAIADAIFLYQSATGSYTEGTFLDALWPASMLFLAAASWQPATRADTTLEGRPLLGTPLVCGLIGLGILTYDHFHQVNLLAVTLAGATIAAVIVRTGMSFRENGRFLEVMRKQAVTDSLTGLGNRRRLVNDLDAALAAGPAADERLLAIFDLDGFKLYNDTFGHPAGDALLERLAVELDAAASRYGRAYRLGGDEFCVLADVPPIESVAFLDACVNALTEHGDGFEVTSSFGSVFLPDEVTTPSEALRLADQRLYMLKRERAGRRAPHEVLLQALYERSPDLREHVDEVVAMAVAVGEHVGMNAAQLDELALGARMHDIGKLAIPDSVLEKPGPLDVNEWAYVKEHVVIGERILAASPGWERVAAIVRATHERWDGNGYVDGLGGADIPLAARIVAVCDAFSAMTSQRPYRLPVSRDKALEELRACSGTQFDPDVVAAFCVVAQLAPQKRRVEHAA